MTDGWVRHWWQNQGLFKKKSCNQVKVYSYTKMPVTTLSAWSRYTHHSYPGTCPQPSPGLSSVAHWCQGGGNKPSLAWLSVPVSVATLSPGHWDCVYNWSHWSHCTGEWRHPASVEHAEIVLQQPRLMPGELWHITLADTLWYTQSCGHCIKLSHINLEYCDQKIDTTMTHHTTAAGSCQSDTNSIFPEIMYDSLNLWANKQNAYF